MDEINRIGLMMECCHDRMNSKDIDMHMVRHVVSLASNLSDYDKSQLLAYCCGQLSGFRQQLKRPIRIKILKEVCHCDENLKAFIESHSKK